MPRQSGLLAVIALLCAAGCSTVTGTAAPQSSATAPASTSATPAGAAATATSAVPVTDPATAVREAVAATGRTSVQINQQLQIDTDEAKHTITITGPFDLAEGRGQLGVDFPEGAISHIDEVFAAGKVYVRGAADMPDGTWAGLDREKAVAHYLLRSPLNDPAHILQQVSTLTQVTRGGEEEVDGTRTAHYSGILTDDALTARLAPEVRDETQTFLSENTDVPVPADVWVDPQGRAVKIRIGVETSDIRSSNTVTYTELGKAVAVTPPAAKDTRTVTDLTGVLVG
ncbi:LppX_LprAFG lipoprotein [Kitasatospora sp. NPDC057223]|uniref:LppX_LprAFG lipoprotein n=1 Tax=Kitasatospora sp. NPDC057223 TaxID=3346055 RepID=UPI00363C1122